MKGKLIGGEEVKELRGYRVGRIIRNQDGQYLRLTVGQLR